MRSIGLIAVLAAAACAAEDGPDTTEIFGTWVGTEEVNGGHNELEVMRGPLPDASEYPEYFGRMTVRYYHKDDAASPANSSESVFRVVRETVIVQEIAPDIFFVEMQCPGDCDRDERRVKRLNLACGMGDGAGLSCDMRTGDGANPYWQHYPFDWRR